MSFSCCSLVIFFFQAEDGIRDLVRSRGLGDVYKRQALPWLLRVEQLVLGQWQTLSDAHVRCPACGSDHICLLYTSDAADERSSVDLGGRRIIKKKTQISRARVDTHTYKKI